MARTSGKSVSGARRVSVKMSAKAVALVIGVARVGQRRVHPEGGQQDRHAAGQHHGDRQALQPEPPEIPQEFLVERLHQPTTRSHAGRRAFR
jgi:hypothetical protein